GARCSGDGGGLVAWGDWGAPPPQSLEAISFLSVETGVELFGLRASLREHHHQDPEKHRKADEARDLPAPARHERQCAEQRGHRVNEEDGLLMGEPHIEEPVMKMVAIGATPAARPSRPSMKLSALFMPTIQSIVKATAAGNESSIRRSDSGSLTKSMWMPAITITAATTTCPRNCQRARSSRKSSTRPIAIP